MTQEDGSYKALMAGSGAAAAGSAGALALYQGDIAEGAEYLNQAKDMVAPVFYDPEMAKAGAESIKDQAVGNVDTAMHFMAGAGLSGLANKVLNPGTRAKALGAGLAGGALGYTMLKEGMYEGAFSTIDLSIDSIQHAANPGEHVLDELTDVEYNADQKRDVKADTAGVMTERALGSNPSGSSYSSESLEPETTEGTELDEFMQEQQDPWTPDGTGTGSSPSLAAD